MIFRSIDSTRSKHTTPHPIPQDGSLPYFGVIVGRVANRIAGASFVLDGVRYTLPRGRSGKDRANCLHGGRRGLDKRLWTVARASPSSVTLTYTSPDGEEGFPGTVQLTGERKREGGGVFLI